MASLTSSTESPASRSLIARERAVAASNYLPLPVVLTGGQGEWLTDIDGRRYLDLMSAFSAASHGHAHPRLIQALVAQAQQLAVTSRAFHTAPLASLLERLSRLTGLAQGLPASGGAESVETAIKAARRWGYRVKGIPEGRAEIAVARGNFHGRSTTIVGFSTEAGYRDDFGPFAPGFRHFDFGDLASVAAALMPHTAAVLIEPIQGEAGIVVPPAGFLRALRELCTAQRVLLIVDEVQSGLGRTGRWFACQHEGVQPDGMILGKALGGGLLPISCFMATRELMQVFEPGSHGSTFGGNPLAAAVALEALQVIENEQLVARSAALGAHMVERLRAIDSPLVRAVRGRGLWAGVDLDPAQVSARQVVERLAVRGVLTKDTHETVIRFAPPLTITRDALDWGIDTFIETLREFAPTSDTRPRPRTGHEPAARAFTAVPPSRRNASMPARPSTLLSSAPLSTTRPAPAAPMLAPPAHRPAPVHLMMSAPDHFEVSYVINPWMDPAAWNVSAARLHHDARQGWQRLRETYEALGARVDVQPPVKGLPDMVFTANAAVVLDGTVMLARFRCAERQGEQAHNRAWFEALRARGVVDHVLEPPAGLDFEGAGDAIWDAHRGLLWTGHGQRSSREMSAVLTATYGVPTVSLELVDPRFYHLDTCFCVLSGGDVVAYRPAFSAAGWAQIEELVGRDKLIIAGDDDAQHLAVNSVCVGRDVVLCHASAALCDALTERGYTPHVVPLASFNRSGGAAYCLTLRLDLCTRPGLPRQQLWHEDDHSERLAA
jgi:ornithine aminotransferase